MIHRTETMDPFTFDGRLGRVGFLATHVAASVLAALVAAPMVLIAPAHPGAALAVASPVVGAALAVQLACTVRRGHDIGWSAPRSIVSLFVPALGIPLLVRASQPGANEWDGAESDLRPPTPVDRVLFLCALVCSIIVVATIAVVVWTKAPGSFGRGRRHATAVASHMPLPAIRHSYDRNDPLEASLVAHADELNARVPVQMTGMALAGAQVDGRRLTYVYDVHGVATDRAAFLKDMQDDARSKFCVDPQSVEALRHGVSFASRYVTGDDDFTVTADHRWCFGSPPPDADR